MKATIRIEGTDMRGAAAKAQRAATDDGVGLYAATRAAALVDKYVPFRSGALSSSVMVNPWEVIYVAPYARYVYNGRGMTFSKQEHPNARSRWIEPLATNPAPLARQVSQYIRSNFS